MNRDPSKGEPAKPSEFQYFSPNSGGNAPTLSATACDTFFSLVREQKIPGWVLSIAPIDRLQLGQKNGTIPYPRALVGPHAILLNPRIDEGMVKSPLAIIDETRADMVAIVKDLDNGEMLGISLPKGAQRYVIDAEFYLN
jgi:hypothetical protein